MVDNLQQEAVKVFLPKLGESITSATVVKWLKKAGDFVHLDEPILEVSTDKVNSEIPSPVSGYLLEVFAAEDQEKEVGSLLCLIGTKEPVVNEVTALDPAPKKEVLFLSPAVTRLIREFNILEEDLQKILPTGANGRITKQDIENFIQGKPLIKEKPKACPQNTPSIETSIEKLKMSKIRKAIAENMAKSFYSAPHASLIQEIDLSKISSFIKKEKEKVLKEKNAKLTFTAFIAYAIARAIEQFPLINSTLDEDHIFIKKQVNLGLAVSVDQAVLVPVIRNAHTFSVIEIAKAIQDLALKAKTQNLDPDDTREGTVTLTNFGMTGTLIGIPIIRFPEVAIIGVGAVTKKVVVLENDSFGIREIAHLSLTFDHRVLDGMYGCGFLAEIKNILENTNWNDACTL